MVNIIDTVTEAIAIKIINKDAILIGRGNELVIVKRHDDTMTMKYGTTNIRLRNKIHDIISDNTRNVILIYGNKEFVFLQIDNQYNFQELHKAQLTDWICGAKFLSNINQVVLLTAHSILLRFEYNVNDGVYRLLERVSCTDKSTLYCAYLGGYTWQDLIIFGGNAFGELLVWKPSINLQNLEKHNLKTSPLLHCITAHKGVIFSICYDEESMFLITTSDDRSLKWWKVIFKTHYDWENCAFQPISINYGHTSRVFRGLIILEDQEHYALSVGEDSYLCLWHSNGKLIFKRRQQFGAVIWNLAYDTINKVVYTVGSCGNVITCSLQDALQNWKKPELTEQICWNKNVHKGNQNANYITKMKFLDAYKLICITNDNYLIQLTWCQDNLFTNTLKSYELIDKLEFKCVVMEIRYNRIALCGYQRFVMFMEDVSQHKWKKVYDCFILNGIIRAFFFLTMHIYLLSDDQGNCVITEFHEWTKQYFKLPKSKEPWLTSALLLSDNHLVVSNRQGHLLLYNNYTLKQSIKQIHGNFGATKLELRKEMKNHAYFYTMGRNNILNIISVDYINSIMKVCTKETIPIAWVENVIQTNYLSQLFVGFNNNHFVVWSNKYDFLIQIPCGGGHRCWDVFISNKMTLAFVKNKKLFTYTKDMNNFALMINCPERRRWHIKSCNAMEVLHDQLSNLNIIVTGGEDNLLKVHQISHLGLELLGEFHGHISNIKTLKIITLSSNELLIVSAGGRAQLCITKLFLDIFLIEEITNYTLKVNNSNSKCNYFPDTRITTLDILASSKNNLQFEIYTGCSDGYIRLLKFYVNNPQIQTISELFYNKCILHIKVFQEENCVIVASTDGYLKLYDKLLSQCLFNIALHESGINAMDINYIPQTRCFKILTGGDDQAVCYTELITSNSQQWNIVYQFRKPFWHNAQVTAVCLQKNGLYGITSGLDQNVYKIDLLKGDIIARTCSTIADIKGLSIWYHQMREYILIYGCGYQILSFNK